MQEKLAVKRDPRHSERARRAISSIPTANPVARRIAAVLEMAWELWQNDTNWDRCWLREFIEEKADGSDSILPTFIAWDLDFAQTRLTSRPSPPFTLDDSPFADYDEKHSAGPPVSVVQAEQYVNTAAKDIEIASMCVTELMSIWGAHRDSDLLSMRQWVSDVLNAASDHIALSGSASVLTESDMCTAPDGLSNSDCCRYHMTAANLSDSALRLNRLYNTVLKHDMMVDDLNAVGTRLFLHRTGMLPSTVMTVRFRSGTPNEAVYPGLELPAPLYSNPAAMSTDQLLSSDWPAAMGLQLEIKRGVDAWCRWYCSTQPPR